MLLAAGMLSWIKKQYVVPGMSAVSYVSAAIDAGIAGIGAYLLIKTRKSIKPSAHDQLS